MGQNAIHVGCFELLLMQRYGDGLDVQMLY